MPGQLLPGLARALTWAGEPWNRKRARMPAPKGTLDTLVNGPEGLPLFDGDAWEHVDWRHHEEQVRRLRGRIFQAVRDGDWSRARSLQKLALRSWSNTLVSGDRRAGRADQPGQGRDGGACARRHRLAPAVPGPAGVYTEGQ